MFLEIALCPRCQSAINCFLSRGVLRNQWYRSVDELLAFFLLLREAGPGLNTPVFGLIIHSVRPGGMGFIPGVWSPQVLEPGLWVYWIPALERGIPVEPLTQSTTESLRTLTRLRPIKTAAARFKPRLEIPTRIMSLLLLISNHLFV